MTSRSLDDLVVAVDDLELLILLSSTSQDLGWQVSGLKSAEAQTQNYVNPVKSSDEIHPSLEF